MKPSLVHISFAYPGPWGDEMAKDLRELSRQIGKTPGLIWKVWIEDSASGRAGGTYLFQSSAAARDYLDSHLQRLAALGISDARVEQYEVNPELSAANGGLPQGALRPASDGAYTTLADVAHQGVARFIETFSKEGLALRRAHGSLGSTVMTARSDPARAFVLIDWRSEDSFRSFRADAQVPATMHKGGATRPPVFTTMDGDRYRFAA